MKVSLIVRSKNEQDTIKRTLKLVTQQTTKPDELILVDNNSHDKTQSIAKKYGCKVIIIKAPKYNHAYLRTSDY